MDVTRCYEPLTNIEQYIINLNEIDVQVRATLYIVQETARTLIPYLVFPEFFKS